MALADVLHSLTVDAAFYAIGDFCSNHRIIYHHNIHKLCNHYIRQDNLLL